MSIHILSDTINNGSLVSDYLRNRYPLTYDANDIISKTNLTNNGTVTFSSQGASFNGSNQWLNGAVTLPTVGAISFWIKTLNYSKGNICGWMIASAPYDVTCVSFDLSYNMRGFYLTPNGSGTRIASSVYNSINFPMTMYTHLVLTWDYLYAYVYRNGIGYPTYINKGTSTAHTNFSIGRVGLYTGSYFSGNILDFRIYSGTTPTPETIQNIYLAGPNMIYQAPKIQNRIFYYRR